MLITAPEKQKRRTSGRFASLMEQYEHNYILVRLLIPSLSDMHGGRLYVSRVEGCLNLELSQIVHDRYTTTFNLTYRFGADQRKHRQPDLQPDLQVRIYHDARACEVVTGILSTGRISRKPRQVRSLDGTARMNRFLSKWLGYLLRQGHGFTYPAKAPAGARREPRPITRSASN